MVVVLAGVTVWPPVSEPLLLVKLPSAFKYFAVTVCGDPLTGMVAVAALVAVLLVLLAPLSATGEPNATPSM